MLHIPGPNGNTPKSAGVTVLRDFQFQTDKQLLAKHLDTVVTDKEQKTPLIDVAERNIRRNKDEKTEKYQGLNEQLQHLLKVKSKMVPGVRVSISIHRPKLEERLQQIQVTIRALSRAVQS